MSFQEYFPNGLYNPFIIKEIDEKGTLIVERPFFEQINYIQTNQNYDITNTLKGAMSVGRTIIDLTIAAHRDVLIQIIPIQSEPGKNWNEYLDKFKEKRSKNKYRNIIPTDNINYFGNEILPDKYKNQRYENIASVVQHEKVEDFTNEFNFNINDYLNHKQLLIDNDQYLDDVLHNFDQILEELETKIEDLEKDIEQFKLIHGINLDLTDQDLQDQIDLLPSEDQDEYNQLMQDLKDAIYELEQTIIQRDELQIFLDRKKIIKKEDLDNIGLEHFESFAHKVGSKYCPSIFQDKLIPPYYGPQKIYVEYRYQNLYYIMFKTYIPNYEYKIYEPLNWYKKEKFNMVELEECQPKMWSATCDIEETEEPEPVYDDAGNESIFTKLYPTKTWHTFSSGIIPLSFIPKDTKSIKILFFDHGANDDIHILTRDGKHLVGGEPLDQSIINPIYGFDSAAIYDSSQLNMGDPTQVTFPSPLANYHVNYIGTDHMDVVMDLLNKTLITTTYNGITLSYSGTHNYNYPYPSNIDLNNLFYWEYLEITDVTEDLLVFSIGNGAFSIEISDDEEIEEIEKSERLPQALVFFAPYQKNYEKYYNTFHIVDHKELLKSIKTKRTEPLSYTGFPLVDSTKCHIIQGYDPKVMKSRWVHGFTFDIQHFLCLVANKYLFDIIVKTHEKTRIYCCHYNTFICCNNNGFNIEPQLILHELDPDIFTDVIPE